MTTPTTRILVVGRHTDEIDRVGKLLSSDPAVTVVEIERAFDEWLTEPIDSVMPHVVVVVAPPDDVNTDALWALRMQYPRLAIIVYGAYTDAVVLERLMSLGLTNYVEAGDDDRLQHVVQHAATVGDATPSPAPRGGKPPPPPPAPAPSREHPQRGKVIACYSPTGGVGTTTVAIHTAYSLMQLGKRVLLVDMHHQFGTVPIFLNLKPQATVADVVAAKELDSDYINAVAETHESGLRVLAGPLRALPNGWGASEFQRALAHLLADVDYVVLDTPTTIDGTLSAVMNMADALLLVSTPRLHSAGNLRKMLDDLAVGADHVRRYLVLNRIEGDEATQADARGRWELSRDSLERFFSAQIAEEVRAADDLILYGIKGTLAHALDTDGQATAPFDRLATRINDDLSA